MIPVGKKRNKNLDNEFKLSKNVFDTDQYDQKMFEDVKKGNKIIKTLFEETKKSYDKFSELLQDCFSAFYKYSPTKLDPTKIDYNFYLNSKIIDTFLESSKYKELREMTKLDALTSTIAMEYTGEEVKQLVSDLSKKAENIIKESPNLQKSQNDANNDTVQSGDGSAQQQLTQEEAKKALEDYRSQIDSMVKSERQAITAALTTSVSKVAETSSMITSWGLDASETFLRSSHQNKLELLKKIRRSDKLKQIAALGRYKKIAAETQRTKIKRSGGEIYDIHYGADLGRMLPSELMKLGNPITNGLFMSNFADHKISQYDTQERGKKNKGPVIVCIDNSGSMSGEPEVWSKAVALGILEICKIQNRSMYVIQFSSEKKEHLKINEFRSKNYAAEDIIDCMEYFSGGGTQFEPALSLSMDKINIDSTYKKSDIIFITDGEAVVSDEFLKDFKEWKRNKGVKVVSVLIDITDNSNGSIKEFSDSIEKLSTIEGNFDESAVTVFNMI